LKKKPSANEIHQSLRMKIVTGKIPSGTRLTEEKLAGEFGVSRTPIREALRMLERDRLITVARGRGASVVSLSRQEVIDTYQCRGTLRGLACRLAAERITPESLARLHRILDALEEAISDEDVGAIFSCTVRFNQVIAEVAGNRVLAELLNALDDRTFRIRFMAHTIPERVRFALDAYRKMYAAFEAHNGAETDLIAQAITENAKDAILRVYYQELPEVLAQPESHDKVS
jgi:DNA-binding GntR family transcriptional regulator